MGCTSGQRRRGSLLGILRLRSLVNLLRCQRKLGPDFIHPDGGAFTYRQRRILFSRQRLIYDRVLLHARGPGMDAAMRQEFGADPYPHRLVMHCAVNRLPNLLGPRHFRVFLATKGQVLPVFFVSS